MTSLAYPIYALVTTYNRAELLQTRSLPSIVNQSQPPNGIVLVDNSTDQDAIEKNKRTFQQLMGSNPENAYLTNTHAPGAAGCWNHGIEWIRKRDPDAWIAILDDDDEWTKDHIKLCAGLTEDVDLVLSGIKTLKNGEEVASQLPEELACQDFYRANPGWQGSNTFIRASFLERVGGFDEELLCTHDRDLAIRCLQLLDFRYTTTGKATVNYYLESDRESFTLTQGRIKQTGLLQFFAKHSAKMDEDDITSFKARAHDLFGVKPEYFDLLGIKNEYPGFPRAPIIGDAKLKRAITRIRFEIRRRWGIRRANRHLTRLLGPAYRRSRDQIEIDLTYACNLRCHDCNRSCRQAPENLELPLAEVNRFLAESAERNIEWKRIRLLGGEPTLHSQFDEILYTFADYKLEHPRTRLEIVTNGHGREVARKLLEVPPFYHIENSLKETDTQSTFYSFNRAPSDLPGYRNTDFTNGCSNIEECGMGLTPTGYYPCAIAGGIDRVGGWGIGRKEIPDESEDMADILSKTCSLCGRFHSRVFIPYDIMPESKPDQITPSWEGLYESWRSERG